MRILILLMIALLGLSGCKKSNEKTTIKNADGTVEVDGDEVKIKTKDGSATINTSKVPDGFPIPMYKGAKVENSTHISDPNGQEIFQLSITTLDTVKQVTEFYEKVFKEKEISTTRTEQSDGENQMIMLFGSSEKLDVSAMVSSDQDSDQTSATISWNAHNK